MSIRNLIPIIIIAFGCNGRNDPGMEGINILSEIKEDSEDTLKVELDSSITLSEFEVIDLKVSEIQNQIEKGLYEKKVLNRKSKLGGNVFELLDSNQNLVYTHSHGGGELGSTELECFYDEGELIYIICRKFEHINMEWNNQKLVFEENNYVNDSLISRRNQVKYVENDVWKKTDLSSEDKLFNTVSSIEAELEKWLE